MACCGQRRAAHRRTASPQQSTAPGSITARTAPSSEYAYFQYLGHTGLTVRGPRSGQTYRFDGPGAVVAVDPRDRRALAAIARLRQVPRPW